MLRDRTTTSITCPNGHENESGLDSCSQCGAPLNIAGEVAARAERRRFFGSPLAWLVLALLLLLVVGGAWAIFRPSNGTAAPPTRPNLTPPSPEIHKQIKASPTTITLSWTAPAMPSGLTLTGFQILAKDGTTVIGHTPAERSSFQVKKVPGFRTLIPGRRYCFQVLTQTADGVSPPSSACAKTDPVSPARSLKTTETSSAIMVTWAPPSWDPPRGTGYLFRVSMQGPSGKPVVRTTGTHTFTFSALPASTSYKIEITARWVDHHSSAKSTFSKPVRVEATTSVFVPPTRTICFGPLVLPWNGRRVPRSCTTY